jgi:mannosyl-3-phosphoglycerate phosphatase
MGDTDKGKAVNLLKDLYQKRFGDIVTIALGDSPVDFPMLEKVDYPVLVRNYKGEHDRRIVLPNLIREEGVGPQGWNRAVLTLIQKIL